MGNCGLMEKFNLDDVDFDKVVSIDFNPEKWPVRMCVSCFSYFKIFPNTWHVWVDDWKCSSCLGKDDAA